MNRKTGIVWGLLAGILWGLDCVLMSSYFEKLPQIKSSDMLVISLIAACFHDGLAALWIYCKNFLHRKSHHYGTVLRSKTARPLILGAVLGGPVGMTGNLLGIQFAGVSYGTSITAVYPVLGAILGTVFLKEKLSLKGIFGILTAVFGVWIVGYSPPGGVNKSFFYIGIGCAVLAVIGWAMEGVVSTYCMADIDSDIAVGIREITSFAVYLAVIFFISLTGHLSFVADIHWGGLWIIGLASLSGAFSYLSWYRSMKKLGVGIAMSLNTTYALWSVFFSIILFQMRLTFPLVMGVCIITVGTVLTIVGSRSKAV